MPFVVGPTGGISSGKSKAADFFSALGADLETLRSRVQALHEQYLAAARAAR